MVAPVTTTKSTVPSTTARPPVTTATPTRTVTVDAADLTPPVISVVLGTEITLTVVSVTDQEFHVHNYDITKAGTRVTFAFTADLVGSHIVESHTTGKVICTIVVS